ncbi:hypothetical protein [Agromyces sp. Root81]|nr:hypothetical protein [Agromyces sp. Root81]
MDLKPLDPAAIELPPTVQIDITAALEQAIRQAPPVAPRAGSIQPR